MGHRRRRALPAAVPRRHARGVLRLMPGAPVDVLRRVPLFADLSKREAQQIARLFKERRFAEGETVVREGSGGAAFFLIDSGKATVSVDGKERATLEPGDYFGEIALIDEGARMATITAASELVCYGLTLLGLPAARAGERGDRLEAAAVAREEASRRPGGLGEIPGRLSARDLLEDCRGRSERHRAPFLAVGFGEFIPHDQFSAGPGGVGTSQGISELVKCARRPCKPHPCSSLRPGRFHSSTGHSLRDFNAAGAVRSRSFRKPLREPVPGLARAGARARARC